MITPYFIYNNDQRKKKLSDFEYKTPTHIDTTHAISTSEKNFQIRIPRKSDQTFYIPGFSIIHLISSNFWKWKKLHKKVTTILFPGIQPNHNRSRYNRVKTSPLVEKDHQDRNNEVAVTSDRPEVWDYDFCRLKRLFYVKSSDHLHCGR